MVTNQCGAKVKSGPRTDGQALESEREGGPVMQQGLLNVVDAVVMLWSAKGIT